MGPGERIKEIRRLKRLTQKDLENSLGYSQGFISEIERGIKEPSRDFLIKFNEVFGISSDYILYGDEEGYKKPLVIKENVSEYEILPTATKKLLDNVKEILESGNETIINALKANIKAFLEVVRISKKQIEDKKED